MTQQMQLPAHLANRQSKGLAQTLTGNLGVSQPPYISIQGNRFTLIDSTGAAEPVQTFDPQKGVYLDCIVIDVNDTLSRIYYDKPFDPNANAYEPPTCWSDNGIGASRNATRPQSASCAACQWSAWGSAVSKVSGKGVPACSQYQKVAVMIPGDEVIFLLRVPPNSLKNLREYVHRFNGQQIDISDVVTRIRFDSSGVGTLVFEAVTYIDEVSFNRREQLMSAKATDGLVGRGDLPVQGQLPAPQQEMPQQTLPPPNQYQPTPGTGQPMPPQQPIASQPVQGYYPPAGGAQAFPGAPIGASAPTFAGAPAAGGQFMPTGQPQVQQPAPQALPANTASPSEQPSGRRPRRKAADAANPAPQQQPTQQIIPPQQAAPQPQQAPFRPMPAAGPAPATNFGIQGGAAPDPALNAMLGSIFPQQ